MITRYPHQMPADLTGEPWLRTVARLAPFPKWALFGDPELIYTWREGIVYCLTVRSPESDGRKLYRIDERDQVWRLVKSDFGYEQRDQLFAEETTSRLEEILMEESL